METATETATPLDFKLQWNVFKCFYILYSLFRISLMDFASYFTKSSVFTISVWLFEGEGVEMKKSL